MMEAEPAIRLTGVLAALDLATSSWYHRAVEPEERKKPGPLARPVDPRVTEWVVSMAVANPWYGYQRIAVMCRRAGQKVSDHQAYRVMKENRLLQVIRPHRAELYQAARLFELLPKGPNELWQMDVTYVHIPGHGWWYVVTVIDYYSRYLLAAYLTHSYSALEVQYALGLARQEAERIGGPLKKTPFLVTDNGSSFIAKRFRDFVAGDYAHVRIQYRTPTQLGLLERFHKTFKQEEVYWRMYADPADARTCIEEFRQRYNTLRPHWALVPVDGGDPVTPQDVYQFGVAVGIPKWQTWATAAKAKLKQMMTEDAA